jgi:hypothetical protein
MRLPVRQRTGLIRALSVLVAAGFVLASTAQAASAHRTADLASSASAGVLSQTATGVKPAGVVRTVGTPNAYFGMTTSVAGTPNQSALFQVSTGVSGTANRMWIAIPTSMTQNVPIGNLRIATTLPGNGSLSYIGGGIQYLFPNIYLPAGNRVWMTIQGLNVPAAGSTPATLRIVSTGNAYLAEGASPGFVTTAPATCRTTGWPTNYVTTENALSGDPNWAFPSANYSNYLAAYAENPSVKCGDTLNLRVNDLGVTTASLTAYRLGYYNGAGARRVWGTTAQPWLLGRAQPSAQFIQKDSTGKTINFVTAKNWTRSFSVVIDDTWTPGDYLMKVTLSNGTGRYVPFVVRDDLGHHSQLVINNSAEWQAYNDYGGFDAYTDTRSTRISFDRPLLDNGGSGNLLTFEYGYIFWGEKQKLDLSYVFDTDVFANPAIMDGQHTVTLIGHPEYWATAAQQHLADVRAAGTNILSLSANALYWRINLQPSTSTGPNREFDITKAAGTDTDTFRMGGMSEQSILGAMYGCSGAQGDGKANASWLWTGVAPGTVVPNLISVEGDEQIPGYPIPAGTQVVDTIALGDGVCVWPSNTSGAATDAPGCPSACSWDSTMHSYQIVSISGVPGGRVFHGSSIGWSTALMNSAAAGQATLNAIAFLDAGVAPPPSGAAVKSATSTDTRSLVKPRSQVDGVMRPNLPDLELPHEAPGQ